MPVSQRYQGKGVQDPHRLGRFDINRVMIWDVQGRIIEANQAILEMLGTAVKKLIDESNRGAE